MASISSTTPSVSRYRLAQAVTFNEITHDFQLAKKATSPEWNLLVVVPVAAGFAVWLSLRSYKRRSRPRLLSDSNCLCDTANFENGKGGANLLPGKGNSLKAPSHSQSAKKIKTFENNYHSDDSYTACCVVCRIVVLSSSLAVFCSSRSFSGVSSGFC